MKAARIRCSLVVTIFGLLMFNSLTTLRRAAEEATLLGHTHNQISSRQCHRRWRVNILEKGRLFERRFAHVHHRHLSPSSSNKPEVSAVAATFDGDDLEGAPPTRRGSVVVASSEQLHKRAHPIRALVTGANGYLGAHIVDQLLRKGYKVVGTVRASEKSSNRVQDFLMRFSDEIESGELILERHVNLTDPPIVNGLIAAHRPQWVFLTAAPFIPANNMGYQEAMDQIVNPMLEMTDTVLAAICKEDENHGVFHSKMNSFSDPSKSPQHAYPWAKTEVEKRLGMICRREGVPFGSVLPGFLLGPPARAAATAGYGGKAKTTATADAAAIPAAISSAPAAAGSSSPSLKAFERWARGEEACQTRLICDVRDCATIHIRLAEYLHHKNSSKLDELPRIIASLESRTPAKKIAEWIKQEIPGSNPHIDEQWALQNQLSISTREVATMESMAELQGFNPEENDKGRALATAPLSTSNRTTTIVSEERGGEQEEKTLTSTPPIPGGRLDTFNLGTSGIDDDSGAADPAADLLSPSSTPLSMFRSAKQTVKDTCRWLRNYYETESDTL
eukprot:jgi/Bigna1/127705/aug1.5_g2413